MKEAKTPINKSGLSLKEVEERISQGKINKTEMVVGKTYFEIIRDNVFSFFNIVLYCIAVLVIIAGYWKGLAFMIIIIPNMAIGLFEDFKARRLMNQMHLVNAPHVKVIRDGEEQQIVGESLVIDDLYKLGAGDQICADSCLSEGSIGVNESLLTGESTIIYKNPGDELFSGSYVVTGSGIATVTKVGKDSYVESIQAVASKFKRSKSEILSSLKKLFLVIDVLVILVALMMFITYGVQGRFSSFSEFKEEIPYIGGSLVAMIPSGLYLLTSLALAVSVITLSKKRANVQDFNSVEMLARVDVLCVDKTGTITDGKLELYKLIPLSGYSEDILKSVAVTIVKETKDENATAQVINSLISEPIIKKPLKVLPFNSENKYSGISFDDETYIIGAYEFLKLKEDKNLSNQYSSLTKKGYRVLVVAKGKGIISNNKYDNEVEAIGLIVLKDHIKDDAIEIFKWFHDNNVEIKVISGDNAATVSAVAIEAGIKNADKYISLEGKSLEEVCAVANEYTVFGRVSPEQKEALVTALQKQGKTAGMTGDGVNDILALKKADCSIAMAKGAEAARNVSHIVLMDSNFSSLPNVVGEGRRVINNLQRTCSVFLVKTIFAAVMTLIFLFLTMCTGDKSIKYPFTTTHMYLWEFVGIGLSSFFLSLEKSNEQLHGKFLQNILLKAVPAGITMLVSSFVIFGMFVFNNYGVMYTGVLNYESAVTMAVIAFTILSVVVLYKVCTPFNLYRGSVFGAGVVIDAAAFLLFGYLSYKNGYKSTLLEINFPSLSTQNYIQTIIVVVILASIYLFVAYAIDVFTNKVKPETKHED